ANTPQHNRGSAHEHDAHLIPNTNGHERRGHTAGILIAVELDLEGVGARDGGEHERRTLGGGLGQQEVEGVGHHSTCRRLVRTSAPSAVDTLIDWITASTLMSAASRRNSTTAL